jgi:signal transduction histidine kinase
MAEIDIQITPPYWKTWWFIIFELTILLFLVYSIYRYLLKLRTYQILKIQNERINLANKKLTISEKNLKVMNATKDKFFSIISHDLKNPFASLLSISESMNDNYDSFDDEEKKICVQKFHNSAKYIYHLLENLLTWSRTQKGNIQFEPVQFNLSKLLNENYNLYKLAAQDKNIKLLSNFQENCIVYGDREMINSVIRNLLNNALKFTPSGKSVEMGAHEKVNETEIYIKDEGVGITNEDLQKLFRIDLKVKTLGTNGEMGTGLGLIICKEFIDKNKGEIKVTSNPGEGSIFSFSVPKSKSMRIE